MDDSLQTMNPMNDMPRLILYKSRKKAVVVTLLGFLFGIAGLLVLLLTDETVLGWCLLIAALFILIYGFGTLYDKRPYVVLTASGITELFTVRQEIAWDAIRYVDDFYFRGQYFVRLILERTSQPEIQPSWFWRFDRIYGEIGVKAVYIRMSGLQINSMQLAGLIRRMAQSDKAGRVTLLTELSTRL